MSHCHPLKISPRIASVIIVRHLCFVLCPLVKHNVQASIGDIKEVGHAFALLRESGVCVRESAWQVCRTHLSEWVAEML
jgi:hypothetical protein